METVVKILAGAVLGFLVCYVFFMPELPELPEPELIPGEPVIEYRDTTIHDTLYVFETIEAEPDGEYKIYRQDVSLFAGAVEMEIEIRAIDIGYIKINRPRLHLQETTITTTDTLRVPYAVEMYKQKCLFDLFNKCIIRDDFTTGVFAGLGLVAIIIYGWMQIYR